MTRWSEILHCTSDEAKLCPQMIIHPALMEGKQLTWTTTQFAPPDSFHLIADDGEMDGSQSTQDDMILS